MISLNSIISSLWQLIQDPGFTKANHSKSIGQLQQSPIAQQQLPIASSFLCTLLRRCNQTSQLHTSISKVQRNKFSFPASASISRALPSAVIKTRTS
ncbi:hypothetical protein Nepgr_012398 [Nepenthes gracilis]|uniref:Uncharacterized protein n=1 Tax=Nepenthes gracilis TaxID=150966 RepID=A0AAD3XMR9_NEPGR|nr:hypothetical protein Nepgr_012398 [Nepenthes gracilis]